MYPCQNSGAKTSDVAIANRPCLLHGIVLSTGTTNAASAILYDNASAASGTKVLTLNMIAGTAAYTQELLFSSPVVCNNGLYLDITGTGAEAYVYFSVL